MFFAARGLPLFGGTTRVQTNGEGNLDRLSFGRRTEFRFPGAGAHHWLLERRTGRACGVYTLLAAADRFSSEQILSEVRCCLDSLMPASGHSVYKLVSSSNPADLFAWRGPWWGLSLRTGGRAIGPVCSTVEAAHDGAGSRP